MSLSTTVVLSPVGSTERQSPPWADTSSFPEDDPNIDGLKMTAISQLAPWLRVALQVERVRST